MITLETHKKINKNLSEQRKKYRSYIWEQYQNRLKKNNINTKKIAKMIYFLKKKHTTKIVKHIFEQSMKEVVKSTTYEMQFNLTSWNILDFLKFENTYMDN